MMRTAADAPKASIIVMVAGPCSAPLCRCRAYAEGDPGRPAHRGEQLRFEQELRPMSRGRAPTALCGPISRVRSCADTSMIKVLADPSPAVSI